MMVGVKWQQLLKLIKINESHALQLNRGGAIPYTECSERRAVKTWSGANAMALVIIQGSEHIAEAAVE